MSRTLSLGLRSMSCMDGGGQKRAGWGLDRNRENQRMLVSLFYRLNRGRSWSASAVYTVFSRKMGLIVRVLGELCKKIMGMNTRANLRTLFSA